MAYVALVLQGATYADVVTLSHITYHQDGYHYLPVRLSASEFTKAQVWSSALGIAFLVVTSLLLLPSRGRWELRALVEEVKQTGTRLHRCLQQLSPQQRRIAWLSLAMLSFGRLYFSFVHPYHTDEVAAYDFFISRGLLAVSSFYPIPNNHVLASTLSWIFYCVDSNPWFVLRLPVLLTATAGTILLFVGVLNFSSFRTALITLTIFGWMQESLYYATAGRGYWLLILGGGLSFLAAVTLLGRGRCARIGWVLLLISGILGCYTMPPFVYIVASATGCLGWIFLRRHAWADLSRTVLVGIGIAAGAAILYAPIILVSGWQSLFANPYVVTTPWIEVVRDLPRFIWSTEGRLLGHRGIGALLLLLALYLINKLQKQNSQATPDTEHLPIERQLLNPILWFLWLPYAVMVVQSVLPPYRVLVYKGLFSALLWGLLAARWTSGSPSRRRLWLVATLLTVFIGYQSFLLVRSVKKAQLQDASRTAAFTWLTNQPSGRIMVGTGEMGLYLLFFVHQQDPHRAWQFDSTPQPGIRYRYVFVPRDYQSSWRLALPKKPAYDDSIQRIYDLGTP